jgi:hypothetical protein
LRALARSVVSGLRPVAGKPPFKLALGVAVPAIEAWLRCGADADVSEEAWRRGIEAGRDPCGKLELKCRVYGTDRPSLAHEIQCMEREATRVAVRIADLERHFPAGFGALARDLREWLRLRA